MCLFHNVTKHRFFFFLKVLYGNLGSFLVNSFQHNAEKPKAFPYGFVLVFGNQDILHTCAPNVNTRWQNSYSGAVSSAQGHLKFL